jgi:GH25 family lysozyme M1 (1,4-beta-N-acetylmuramidase)
MHMIFGVDVHPQFQAGLNIEQVRREGFSFLASKVSQGVTAYNSFDWFRRGQAVGLQCLGYHYLEPGNEAAQARVFADQLSAAGVPGMLDAEYPLPDGDTLTVAGIRAFVAAARGLGARVPLLYLPRWYWQRMGSPDLSGLPTLWASSYVNGTGFASALYESVTPSSWAPYGHLPVSVLQFSDRGLVAGQSVDVDVYDGTPDQFAALLTGVASNSTGITQPKDVDMTYQLLPTPIPTGAKADAVPDGTWDAVEDTITAPGPAGGWRGRILQHLTFGYGGGFIQEAWSAPSGRHFVTRYDPVAKTGGQSVVQFATQHYELPAGDIALIVRYATRARGSVTPEVEH